MGQKRLWVLPLCCWALAGQDAYRTCPKNYLLEYENEFVRISRVRHAPGDSLPVHSHPSIPTVYVYLTDAGPVRFSHVSPKFTIVRPPVVLRTPAVAVSIGDRSYRFLRMGDEVRGGPGTVLIELKTAP